MYHTHLLHIAQTFLGRLLGLLADVGVVEGSLQTTSTVKDIS